VDKNLLRRRQLLLYFGLGIVGTAAIASPGIRKASTLSLPADSSGRSNPSDNTDTATVAANSSAAGGETLPEFQGIGEWLNSSPLTIAGLKGNVILVQFWTFACINCQRTLPYIVQWHQTYAARGLKVIGVHTPEFGYERETNNIKRALQEHQITYPVPVDNNYRTWNAYKNNYWPHLYLADRQGILRYDHIGEGAYDETEAMIRQLLG
jgi:thiol-disulfide isomerase/thioredoxin